MVLRNRIVLFLVFMGIWGCKEDIPVPKSSVSDDEILTHWVGTHNSEWNRLLLEKIVVYEHEDSLTDAYARDLKILLYAEKYYRKQLAGIYGCDCDNDFLYNEWEKIADKVLNGTIRELDCNTEWNLYRKLYYSAKPEDRECVKTRSDEILVEGCDFLRPIHEGLAQMGISPSNINAVVPQIFRELPPQIVFGPTYSGLCNGSYNQVLRLIRQMKENSGSSFNLSSCRINQFELNNAIKKLMECITVNKTQLEDKPLPPGDYYPPYPGGGSNPQKINYHLIYNECTEISIANGKMFLMFTGFLRMPI